MKNAINWFEIPVTDLSRAKKFYDTVLEIDIQQMDMPGMKYGVFPYDNDEQGVGGGLVQMEGFTPSTEGPTLYLPGGDDLTVPLARVEAAGGKIIQPKTDIGENGFMAQFIDTEGNRLALHSMN